MSDLLIKIIADFLLFPIALIGAYALVAYIPNNKKLHSYARIAMAGLTALLVAKLIGSMWQPDAARPFIEMGIQPKAAYLDNAGFPSDHVLFATAIVLAVWFETRRKNIVIALTVLTILVGLGRVLAFVHTPLDVLGGILFACFGAIWYFTDAKKTKHKKK